MMNLSIELSDLSHHVIESLKGSTTKTVTSILALFIVVLIYRSRRGSKTPRLQGPASESFMLGCARKVFPSNNVSLVYQEWERIYGPVYEIPFGFGTSHIVLSDPKALVHLYSKDTVGYCQSARQRETGRKIFGDIVVLMEGDTHKRMRRAMSSPLSISVVRSLTSMCFDSAYQLKAVWDACFESSKNSDHGVVLDVEKWMNCIAMDNMGKAVLSIDLGNLTGPPCAVLAALDAFHSVNPSGIYTRFVMLTADIFYVLFKFALPNNKVDQRNKMAASCNALTDDFLTNARKEPESSAIHQSMLGILLKSENANSSSRLSLPEIIAQAGGLILAGYEAVAIALAWSLIELARWPEIQKALRAELRECLGEAARPTHDQLTKDLKYLDAFISEILRFHPSKMQLVRVASEDDMMPLTDPIRIASGALIDNLFVKKGTVIRIPVGGVNMSEAMWGPDAGIFDPNRWLDNRVEKGKKEKVPGYRNLLTFGSGPRMCPGRDFAMLEMKVILSVLVRHFAFEFPEGPSTELDWQFGRPKVAGEDGPEVPMLVRKLT